MLNTARYQAEHTQDGRGRTTLKWSFTIDRLMDAQEPKTPWRISMPDPETLLEENPRAAVEHMASWFERMAEGLRAAAPFFPDEPNTRLLLSDTGNIVFGREKYQVSLEEIQDVLGLSDAELQK
jgi:hypothetical protein